MTQEEKQLLLFDISSRFPYGLHIKTNMEKYPEIILDKIDKDKLEDSWYFNGIFEIIDCKPYLRPMSSMTEEERGEFRKVGGVMSYSPQHDTWAISAFAPEAYDWLNKNMFDYRGLIEKGLALEALKEMYKI